MRAGCRPSTVYLRRRGSCNDTREEILRRKWRCTACSALPTRDRHVMITPTAGTGRRCWRYSCARWRSSSWVKSNPADGRPGRAVRYVNAAMAETLVPAGCACLLSGCHYPDREAGIVRMHEIFIRKLPRDRLRRAERSCIA